MTDLERRRQIEDLCDAALELDPAERAHFIATACGDDAALRQDVNALLAYAEAADGFLASPLDEVAAHVMGDRDRASLVGRQIGPHKIVDLLGAGGMGDVYRAHDTKLGRDVAIKVVADAFRSSPERLARFEHEARVLASLNHPHIGAIYGLEEADGVCGLVLELVEGTTLAERLRRERLPIREALLIARQIADALEAAHDKGIIHRDLKPANIKITPDGTVKVLDFGLAKVFSREGLESELQQLPTITAGGTAEGVIAGTAAYMSPEQARGKPIDKRTDIWAFGCVLYEMLTGRMAFPGDTPSDTIARILEREPDWTALPIKTPSGIRRLIERCLEKDARRRLRDIGDARLEIDDTLDGKAAAAPDTAGASASRDDSKTSRRRLQLIWVAATGSVLLIIGAAVASWLQRSEYFWRSPLEGVVVTPLTDSEGAAHHAAISPDGKFVAFLSDREGTWDAWGSQVGTGEAQNLTKGTGLELRNPATRTLGFSPDGLLVILWNRIPDAAKGGVVDAGWAVPAMGGPVRPFLKGYGISELDWSPDARRIVYHTPAPGDPMFVTEPDVDAITALSARPEAGHRIYEAAPGIHNHFPVWSPDGAFIYFVQGFVQGQRFEKSDVWRIRTTGGKPERLTSHNSRVTFPVLLGNRTLLYLATDADGLGPWIYTIDVERRVPRLAMTSIDPYMSLAASKDGQRLVATVSRSTASLWRVPIADRVIDASGAAPVALPTAGGFSPRVGPGFMTYRAPKARTFALWKRADDGAKAELWSGLEGRAISGAAGSPDGKRLAFLAQRQGVTHLYVMNADGTGARRIAGDLDVRGMPAWSPDGEWLAVSAMHDGVPKLHRVPAAGGPPRLFVNEYSTDPVWAPSGTFLVYSDADVGTTFSVKAVGADGTPRRFPHLTLTRGARRLAFLGDDALIILRGDVSHKEFWLFDLKTGRERQLTNLGRAFSISDFDLSTNGREIIFERPREESNIVLLDLPRR